MQGIAPEHLDVGGLAEEMRLVGQHDRQSQAESTKVTSPPVPARLPENRSIASKKTGSRNVTVNDSHQDFGMLR